MADPLGRVLIVFPFAAPDIYARRLAPLAEEDGPMTPRIVTLVESFRSGWHIQQRAHPGNGAYKSETLCDLTIVARNLERVSSIDGWGAICAACRQRFEQPA